MKTEQKTVRPSLLSGFQDILPARMIPFQKLIARIKIIFESFGFVPLETPGMERLEVLTGGSEDFNKSIFRTRVVRGAEDRGKDLGDEDSALRFDLTVPLARVVASYQEIPRPFKRYQIGKVWRGEKPQNNRYREFFQFDADIVGSNSILADTEIVQVIYATLSNLELPKFSIRINDRRILNGLAEILNCSDKCKELDRAIDKIDSLGVDGVIAELTKESDTALTNPLLLNPEQIQILKGFLALKSETSSELLNLVEKFFEAKSEDASKGIDALKALTKNLLLIGIPEEFWKIDLAVARGLDYYSGPVFETVIEDMPDIGSIFSGGRFDGLVNRFDADINMPGVGASVGVDRLFTALTRLGRVKEETSVSKVLVTIFDQSLAEASLACASRIRRGGVPTEIYLGNERTIKAQLGYALKQGIRFVIILGPDEIKSGKVALRDLDAKKQELLTEKEASDMITLALQK
ncbi:MAG: histidine--tRNA ligase [Candidatus Taylorbacteria bacterium]